jgi:hypothetical protein
VEYILNAREENVGSSIGAQWYGLSSMEGCINLLVNGQDMEMGEYIQQSLVDA